MALYKDPAATLDDLREAVRTLEDAAPIVRRVFGGSHPLTVDIEDTLRMARAELREAVTTFAEIKPTARRVLGSDHPFTVALETSLQNARAALRANESGAVSAVCEALRKAEV